MGSSFDVAKRRVSGDLTKSSEPRKAITINRLSKPSKTKRRSNTKDLEDFRERISGKDLLDSKGILRNSNGWTGGGRKLKDIGSSMCFIHKADEN
jgi:hypothetical protein